MAVDTGRSPQMKKIHNRNVVWQKEAENNMGQTLEQNGIFN